MHSDWSEEGMLMLHLRRVDATDDPMAIQSGNKTLPRAAYPVQTRARASIQEREAEQLIIPAKPAQPPVAAFSRPLPSLPAKETPRAVSSTRAIHTHEPEPPSTRRLLSQPPRRRLSSNAQSRPRPNMSFSNGIVPNAETNGNEEAVERTTQKVGVLEVCTATRSHLYAFALAA